VRVALVSTPFVPVPPKGYGGTELIVHELAKGLTSAGHRVTLFATGDSSGPDLRHFWREPVWPPDPYAELLHAKYAASEIASGRFDVVHAHCAAMLAFASDIGTPMVYTIHHERLESFSRFYQKAPLVRFVAISRRQGELEEGLASDVVHHGLDPDLHPPGKGDGGHALFLGRLSWCKGPDLAVEASRRAGVPLVVAGQHHEDRAPPGWREEVLLPALASPGVRWVGEANGSPKQRLLGGARALLMPLRWEEPFGLVMIEAMLSGTPVVAFPLGAAPEIVDEGVTGFLVRDVDGMAAALRWVDRLDRRACRRRALARFSSARMVRDYLTVYRRACEAPIQPAAPEGDVAWTRVP
jgi:glycosyltransferase involved in cell wall biosynthesis